MIISLILNLSSTQLHPQMVTNLHNQIPQLFSSNQGIDDGSTSNKPLPEFNPDDLVGRTFLLPMEIMERG